MSSGQSFVHWLQALLPLASALLAAAIDLAPRPAAGGGGVSPFLTLAVVFFWSVYRPDLMTAPAVFVVGIVYDVCAGLPVGLTSLVLLLMRRLLIVHQNFVYAKPFLVVWALVLVVVPVVALVRYAFGALWFGVLADPSPMLVEAALTIAWYPVLAWLLVRLHGQIAPARHAES